MSITVTNAPDGTEKVVVNLLNRCFSYETLPGAAAVGYVPSIEHAENDLMRRLDFTQQMMQAVLRFLAPFVAERTSEICKGAQDMPKTTKLVALSGPQDAVEFETLECLMRYLIDLTPGAARAPLFSAVLEERESFRRALTRFGHKQK